ncbi:hypothetical protein [Vibrio alginolyticus]|uniref:hypothetical protein n=1 Tax=Vibrio alginolyticus TaxID=663 RepID=UPI003D12D8A3
MLMALITCTECGKEYSDKASACINCGCPTEVNIPPPQQEPEQTDIQNGLEVEPQSFTPEPKVQNEQAVQEDSESEVKQPSKVKTLLIWGPIIFLALTIMGEIQQKEASQGKQPTRKQAFTHPLLESGANVPKGIKENPEAINQLTEIISLDGYKCNTVSGIVEMSFSRGFSVWCNNHNYEYEIEDKGGNWVVTLQ